MPAAASARSWSQTAGPADPSVVMSWWDSNAITAPRVTVLVLPGVQRLSREAGSGHRQLKVPSCAFAASWGALSGPAGVKLSGR